MEIRRIPATVLPVHLGEDDHGPRFAGAAAIYNHDLQLWPGAVERFAPGCFDIDGPIVASANLGHRFFIGVAGGSLHLQNVDDMLVFVLRRSECDEDHQHLFEVGKLCPAGSMIGYVPTQVEWSTERGKLVRTIKAATVEAVGLDFTESLPISKPELADLRKEAQRKVQAIKQSVLSGVERRAI